MANGTPLDYETPSKRRSARQMLGTVLVIVGAILLAALGVAAYGWALTWLLSIHDLFRHPAELILGPLVIVLYVYKLAYVVLARINRRREA